MLDKIKLLDAVRYNSNKVNKLWKLHDLPEPLSDGPIDSEFVAWVCAYQTENKIVADGKIGPKTLEFIKAERNKVKDITKSIRKSSPPSIFMDDRGPSNMIIILGKRVKLPEEMIVKGYIATNYLDDGEPRFSHKRRKHALTNFVCHETCGSTAEGCKITLIRERYGVQLIMDPWGRISCHGDLVLDQVVHANQLNSRSIGMEVVNPYSPIYVRDRDEELWVKRIPRQWWTWKPSAFSEDIKKILKRKGLKKVPNQYVCPTDDQMESARIFIPWVVKKIGLFPYEFPTENTRKKVKFPGPGVVAHRDLASHSDGRYMLEMLIRESKK